MKSIKIIILSIFIITFGFYLFAVCPTIYGGDTGELVVASHVLGVPHAPGYPVFCLLGKFFEKIVIFGNPAYRINIFSAFVMALTSSVFFLLLVNHFNMILPSLFGVAVFSFSPIAFEQAQVSEVFALNVFIVVALVILLFKVFGQEAEGSPFSNNNFRYFLLAAFVFGLGLGNHQTLVMVLPGLAYLLYRSFKSGRLDMELKHISALGFFLLIGFFAYAYLPIRSYNNPPVNFGAPHTLGRFLDVLTRKEFGTLELHPAAIPYRDMAVFGKQILQYFGEVIRQSGISAAILAIFGVFALRKKDFSRGLFLIWFISGPFFYFFSNLSPQNAIAMWRLERFHLMPGIFIAFFMTAGIVFLVKKSNIGRYLLVFLVISIVCEHIWIIKRPVFRWNLVFGDMGTNIMRTMKGNALLVIDQILFDEPTSALSYKYLVKKKRGDVRVIYRPGTMFELFYGEDFLEVPREQRFFRRVKAENELWKTLDKPLYFMAFEKKNLPEYDFGINGILYEKTGPENNSNLARAGYLRRRFFLGKAFCDYPTRLALVHYPYFRGKAFMEGRKFQDAKEYFRAASSIGHDMVWLHNNIGALWSQYWDIDEAEKAYKKAIQLDEFFPQAQFGYGFVMLQKKMFNESIAAYTKAVRLRPDWPEASYMLGVAYKISGDMWGAVKPWENYLKLDPSSQRAGNVRRELAKLKNLNYK